MGERRPGRKEILVFASLGLVCTLLHLTVGHFAKTETDCPSEDDVCVKDLDACPASHPCSCPISAFSGVSISNCTEETPVLEATASLLLSSLSAFAVVFWTVAFVLFCSRLYENIISIITIFVVLVVACLFGLLIASAFQEETCQGDDHLLCTENAVFCPDSYSCFCQPSKETDEQSGTCHKKEIKLNVYAFFLFWTFFYLSIVVFLAGTLLCCRKVEETNELVYARTDSSDSSDESEKIELCMV